VARRNASGRELLVEKVIFDTDPGIDDAMALLFLKRAPGVEIVGVTSSFGNGTIETTTRNLLHLCQVFGIDAPVAEGAAHPLVGEARPAPDHVHGANGLGDIVIPDVPRTALHESTADAFIVEMIHRFPHQITLIAVARMTNLALALRRDPSIAGLVRQVIVMAGAFGFHGHSGNMTPVAETNAHGDPLAADEVFGASWPVTIVGLDVTQETIIPSEMVERIGHHGGPEGCLLCDAARFYLDFHRASEGMDGMFTHDPSAVAYLIDPSLFTTRRGPIRVVTEGIAMGQTIQKPDTRKITPPAWQGRPSQTICTGVDAPRLLDLYYRTVTGG
jgi:inosine-uridine nucleoside N-ribohydrolase